MNRADQRIPGVVVVVLVLGCSAAPGPRSVKNPDPLIKIPAIKEAVQEHDLGAARQLVKDLDSDDAAVRFFAIAGLRRMNDGDDLGYHFYEKDDARKAAVKRWQDWLGTKSSSGSSRKDHEQPAATA
jgi:hypothetical protein